MLAKLKSYWNVFIAHFSITSNRKILAIITLAVVAIALPLTVLLSQNQQTIRQRASELVSPPNPPSPTPIASNNRVFVTSTTYNGNLGGLAGADAKCQERATAATLGGNWKAWISTFKISASSRLNHSNNPYKLINGTVIADNWSELTRGVGLKNPLNINEFGNKNGDQNWVWTDTSENGNSAEYSYPEAFRRAMDCKEWTSSEANNNTAIGGFGSSSYIDYRWTKASDHNCDLNQALYCFEQPSASPTPTPELTFDMEGQIVDINGNLFENFPYLGGFTTIRNTTTNNSLKVTGDKWTVGNLKPGEYEITAENIAGYKVEHMVCFGCISNPLEKFHAGNKFTFSSGENRLMGITFRYSPIPTTKLDLTVSLTGIGIKAGDNTNPLNKTRQITIDLIKNTGSTTPPVTKTGTVTYDSSTGNFKGTIDFGNSLSSGTYIVKVKISNYLKKQFANPVSITPLITNVAPLTTLTPGDTNNNGIINTLDGGIISACFGKITAYCLSTSDLNDDGKVDGVDFNLFVKASISPK